MSRQFQITAPPTAGSDPEAPPSSSEDTHPLEASSSSYIPSKHNNAGIPVSCGQCAIVLPSLAALDRHLKWHDGGMAFICGTCGDAMDEKEKLHRHKEAKDYDLSHLPHGCSKCPHRVCDATTLQFHEKRLFPRPKAYPCHTCYKWFDRPADLWRHRIGGHGDPHLCDFCGARYERRITETDHFSWCSKIPDLSDPEYLEGFNASMRLAIQQ